MVDNKGFSLLEVLVAIILFSIIFVGLQALLNFSLKLSKFQKNYGEIVQLTQNVMVQQFMQNSQLFRKLKYSPSHFFLKEKKYKLNSLSTHSIKISTILSIKESNEGFYIVKISSLWKKSKLHHYTLTTFLYKEDIEGL